MATHIALATCSALPSHEHDDLPLHAALREAGVEVEEPIWDDPGVDWSRFSAVLIRTTWDYQDKHGDFVAWAQRVAAGVPLLNPAPVVAWNTHKLYLRELEAHGVPLAPTLWLPAGRTYDLPGLIRGRGFARAFLKPMMAANSRGTLRFDVRRRDELDAAATHLSRLGANLDMMLQPYLDSVEGEGEVSAIYFDGVLSHAVRKIPQPGDYRVQDDFGARDEAIDLDPEARALGRQTLDAFEAVCQAKGWAIALPLLYARVDMLRDLDGRLVVNELELVEPSLFFRHDTAAPGRLADALLRRVAS